MRWDIDFTRSAATNVALLQGGAGQTAGTIYNHFVVMPGAWSSPAGTVTCSNDATMLSSAVSVWVAQVAALNQIEKYAILNIANEWGPSNSTVWRDSYISAISQMRAAGYHATLSIDSGGCGQDNADLVKYAQAVFDSDPEKNVIFDRHVYGGDADVTALNTRRGGAGGAGASDHLWRVWPRAEHRSVAHQPDPRRGHPDGGAIWVRMDGLGVGRQRSGQRQADNAWFALSYAGTYTSSGDLTIFGQQVVEGCTNPAPGGCGCPDSPVPAMTVVAPGCAGTPAPAHSTYSLKALAMPATIF